jgi:DNA-binding FadR family transcriptional regulator
VKRDSLHGRVVGAIGKSILSGEHPPGSVLPTEAVLCSTLGVSRTALREAMRVLAAKGLLTARPKIGTVVRPFTAWNYLDADVLAWRLQGPDAGEVIAELYELRHLVEPMAASLAAGRATGADLDEMRHAFQAMEAAGDDGERIIEPDVRFHMAIICASGNKLFGSLAHAIGAALAASFRIVSKTPRGHRHSMPPHRKVMEAVVEGDAVAARLAMQKLIDSAQDDVRLVRHMLARAQGRVKVARAIPRRNPLTKKGAA